MKLWRDSLAAMMALALLSACDSEVASPVAVVASDESVIVRGRATKGPLAGARIELVAVNDRGRAVGSVVATTVTDEAGNWTALVPADHDGLLVRSVGGRFVDESDANLDRPRTIELGPDDALVSFLPAGESIASVTLLSHALVEKTRLEVDAANFAQRLAGNRDLYTAVLGLDPLATVAADPLAPVGSAVERRYALLAGALAYALNALAIERGLPVADFATIELLLSDLVDCRLDGLGLGGQTLYDIVAFQGRTLDDEILRFRNNHFDDYVDLEPAALRAGGCPATPGASDAIAPVFTSQAAPLILPATDATGVATVGPLLEQAAAAFAVSDDRDAAPRIDIVLPARLPLGRSVVVVRATDNWGNVTTTDWQIDVLDLAPPELTVPPGLTVAATAARTPVALGNASATDNVSAGAALVVSNDAPLDGFPVGDTVVTWLARDEAGLVTSATQTVTVIGAQPQVAASIAPVLGAVGSEIDLDLSIYFSDPFDATLSFTLSGLPADSGLSFDALSGRLTGVAGAADYAAAPLQLTVSATNGQFEAMLSFELSLAPRAPTFFLSVTDVQLDEDFAGQPRITSTPAAPTPVGATTYAVAVAEPVVDVSIDQNGTLTLSSIADAFGSTTVDVVAANVVNGETVVRRIDVVVRPVNDPPVALLSTDSVTVVAAAPAQLNLAERFRDVDDADLVFAVTMQPRSLSLGAGGVLQGTPLETEAAVALYPIVVTATDAAGASATTQILLDIAVPDRDGDGLSDAREAQLGTDPDAVDSDADGVDDATELAAGADPMLPAANVIYLSPTGNNVNDGGSFTSALRDLGGLDALAPGISAAQPTFVLLAAADEQRYGGSLWLMPPCDHIVFAGSISPTAGGLALAEGGAPRTTLTALQAPSLEIDGCQHLRIVNLAIADNTRHAVHIQDSTVALDNVHLRHNRADISGGALSIADSDVTLRDVLLGGNDSGGHGGAVAVSGGSGSLTLANVALHGNVAAGDGGGLYVDSAGVDVAVDNVLLTGNVADRGAGLFVATATTVAVRHATVAQNRSRQPGQGAAIDAAPGAVLLVRDSVVIRNADGQGVASALADNIDSDFNSMDREPLGANDLALAQAAPVFGQRYLVSDAARAIDLGSQSAVAAGFDGLYSVTASLYPDEGTVDRGFHSRRPGSVTPLSEQTLGAALISDPAARSRFPLTVALDVTPREPSRLLGSGHRVSLTPQGGRSDLINTVRSVPAGDASVRATDLGDGRYRVYLDTRPGAARRFILTVDGVSLPAALELACPLYGCAGVGPTVPLP